MGGKPKHDNEAPLGLEPSPDAPPSDAPESAHDKDDASSGATRLVSVLNSRPGVEQRPPLEATPAERSWTHFYGKRAAVDWIDLVWLLFIVGLAVLPPIHEIHKQLILVAFGIFQFLEGSLLARYPNIGRYATVAVKIILATVLLDHTGDIGINSAYWPIYFLPAVTAAIYFGPLATLLWTAIASAGYCSYLIPALKVYELTEDAETTLAIRILFFFLAAMLVNRFVVENRRQVKRYQELSETLEQTNRQLRRAEVEARRSERLAALGQMSAGLAHEIRNPLGVIKGSAEMLSQKLTSAQPLAAELAGYISSEVDRLNALVARFLDFARPVQIEAHPRQISEIVDRAVESVEHQFPKANVHVARDYAPALPDVMVDEQLCERVFINLIQNAFQAIEGAEFTRAANLKLAIAADKFNARNGVGVVIEDNGPGVPPELREQIFNPFFTSKKDGVGLGLAIVAKILDEHGGSIWLEDSARGARFRVFLPSEPQPK